MGVYPSFGGFQLYYHMSSLASSYFWPLLLFLVHFSWLFNWCDWMFSHSQSFHYYFLLFSENWGIPNEGACPLLLVVSRRSELWSFLSFSKFWLILHCSLSLWSLICVMHVWVLIQFVVPEMEVNRALLVTKYGFFFLVIRIRVLGFRNFMLQMIKREEVWANY